jgi:hypothetical protein
LSGFGSDFSNWTGPDPDPSHKNFFIRFLTRLNIIYEVNLNNVFISIRETVKNKKGKNMSILVASNTDPEPDPQHWFESGLAKPVFTQVFWVFLQDHVLVHFGLNIYVSYLLQPKLRLF